MGAGAAAGGSASPALAPPFCVPVVTRLPAHPTCPHSWARPPLPPRPPLRLSHPQPPWLSGLALCSWPHPAPLEPLSGCRPFPRCRLGPSHRGPGAAVGVVSVGVWTLWLESWMCPVVLHTVQTPPQWGLCHTLAPGPCASWPPAVFLTSFLPAWPCSSCRTAQLSPPLGSPRGLFLAVSLMSLSVWLQRGAQGWS